MSRLEAGKIYQIKTMALPAVRAYHVFRYLKDDPRRAAAYTHSPEWYGLSFVGYIRRETLFLVMPQTTEDIEGLFDFFSWSVPRARVDDFYKVLLPCGTEGVVYLPLLENKEQAEEVGND
jgi:hypothetical protein